MTLRSPITAIAWQIWSRSRAGLISVVAVLVLGGLLLAMLRQSVYGANLARPVAFALTVVALLVTLGCFHFTEGSRKGGFGSFPLRLFHLPVRTSAVVALPMLYGGAAVVLVYLLCAGLLLRPVGPDLPLLWPCLYLVFGLSQFQMIIWSLPDSRYLKLLCLSVAASIVTFGWMFFIPTIVAGALSEWGYAGDPELFMRGLLVGLALTGPAAYGVSFFRLHQQRHGLTARSALMTQWWEERFGQLFRRRSPFRSADHAILWQEWRRGGFILPTVAVVVVALTGVPAWLSGGLSGRATLGILTWLFVAPFLLAIIIGRGFGKPDFWSPSLKIAPLRAIQPVNAGQWVFAKLKVALASAALTWSLVIYLGVTWTMWAGDPSGLEVWIERLRFYYSPLELGLLGVVAPLAVIIATWRCLVAGLAWGLSGSKAWYYCINLLTGAGLVLLLIVTIRRTDGDPDQLRLHHLWPLVTWMPAILTSAVVIKMATAALAWRHVLRRQMTSPSAALRYVAGWLVMVAIVTAFFFTLSRNTLWLRHLLMLMAILLVPLAEPAIAMRTLAANRSSP